MENISNRGGFLPPFRFISPMYVSSKFLQRGERFREISSQDNQTTIQPVQVVQTRVLVTFSSLRQIPDCFGIVAGVFVYQTRLILGFQRNVELVWQYVVSYTSVLACCDGNIDFAVSDRELISSPIICGLS